ncbi:MAG: molybdopterin-dependent oxidoreductase [Hyphomicrobiaceae bacterium]
MTNKITSSHWGAGVIAGRPDGHFDVMPYPADPDPSRINENIGSALRSAARILRPAVRKSYLENGPSQRKRERGAEPFVEVSWDTILDLITREVNRVRKIYGNEAIYGGSYGWASAGRFHHAQGQLKRFLNATGGFVRSEGNYSYNAALMLMPHILGNFRQHLTEATRWSSVARYGQLVVMFGGLPLRNVQVSGGGVAKHRLRDQLKACAKAGVRFINFSPLRSDALDELSAEWLAPRPGSDTAIMMGIAHTLLENGTYDSEFLQRYTVGFDKLDAYLSGKVDGVEKSAEWASDLSEVPAEKIRRLAQQMWCSRSLITTAASLQRADFGEQPIWMTVALASMLGQIGQPGCGFGIAYGADASIGTMTRPMPWASLSQGHNPVEDFIPVAMITEMLERPGGSYEYNGAHRAFPDIRLIWWAGGNPFHHHQDLNRLRRAWQKPDTVIVNEIFWTATARHADIVLPIASSQERDDFGGGTQDNALIPMPHVIDPPDDVRTEFDIFCELEKRLSLNQRFSMGMDDCQWREWLWETMREMASSRGQQLPDLERFMSGGVFEFDDPAPFSVFLEDFRRDPEGNPLPTPSERIEIASEVIAGFGYDDCPGHPTWLEPREWLGNATDRHPLHLISGQPETRLHGQYDAGTFSRERKVQDREPILINSIDAGHRQIANGDIVLVSNERGQCLAGAIVTDDVRPGVVFLWTGATFDPDLDHPHHLDRHGNPNVLTQDRRTSRLSQGPAAQSVLVQITKFVGEPPAVRAFNPPIEGFDLDRN